MMTDTPPTRYLSTTATPRGCKSTQHRRMNSTICLVLWIALIVAVFPLRAICTIVEAPTHLLGEEPVKDEDLAAFVSSSDHAPNKNIHHHHHQQHNSQHVQTPEDLAAFVADHPPNKNIPPTSQQQPQLTLQQQQQLQQQQRRWGTAAAAAKNSPTPPIPPTRTVTGTTAFQSDNSGAGSSNESFVQEGVATTGTGGLPFVQPKVVATASPLSSSTAASPVIHAPPEGFVVTARVYTDPVDKLSHFDAVPTNIVLPFYECGTMGLSTNALPLSHASFRHALAGSQVWSGDFFMQNEDEPARPQGHKRRKRSSKSSSSSSSPSSPTRLLVEEDERQDWHPQLVVALTELEIVLNSGENRLFHRGDVILLEDTVLGGHKLRAITTTPGSAATNSNSQLPNDMTVLILTLPHYYHQIGKGQHSLQGFTTTLTTPPCPIDDEDPTKDPTLVNSGDESALDSKSKSSDTSPLGRLSATFAIPQSALPRRPRKKQVQQVVLGMIGISISTLLADFLGKVAPLWLAVGIGGTCFVVGGTYGIVTTGMQALEYLDMTWERQRLLSSITATTPPVTTATPTTATATASSTGGNAAPADRPELHPKPLDPPFYER